MAVPFRFLYLVISAFGVRIPKNNYHLLSLVNLDLDFVNWYYNKSILFESLTILSYHTSSPQFQEISDLHFKFKMDGNWDVVTTLLQDICNSNEVLSLNNLSNLNFDSAISTLNTEENLKSKLQKKILNHKENTEKCRRILDNVLLNIKSLLENNKSGNSSNIVNDFLKELENDSIMKSINSGNNAIINGTPSFSNTNKSRSNSFGKSTSEAETASNTDAIDRDQPETRPRGRQSSVIGNPGINKLSTPTRSRRSATAAASALAAAASTTSNSLASVNGIDADFSNKDIDSGVKHSNGASSGPFAKGAKPSAVASAQKSSTSKKPPSSAKGPSKSAAKSSETTSSKSSSGKAVPRRNSGMGAGKTVPTDSYAADKESPSRLTSEEPLGNLALGITSPSKGKAGRSFYTSQFNPSDPVIVGSDVAFKPRQKDAEWIQCVVTKVLSDNGTRFEVKDPEPDDNLPNGQLFKANWKDIILIPPMSSLKSLPNYPYGTHVLARYPETTTFYPAEVIGFKRDGTCRLKFEGEEEVGKETEVERRHVLPFPG
ncbi:hypothetical protein B5S28_g1955 [[Candida] boidinii]|nr:hypothetical protein B5S28_g1955 [[Candida] boidinii]